MNETQFPSQSICLRKSTNRDVNVPAVLLLHDRISRIHERAFVIAWALSNWNTDTLLINVSVIWAATTINWNKTFQAMFISIGKGAAGLLA